MEANLINLPSSKSDNFCPVAPGEDNLSNLQQLLCEEMKERVKLASESVPAIAERIVTEVQRICDKSARIQKSGKIPAWRMSLAKHRLQKCLHYYELGSKRARMELHSTLGAMIYRHVTMPGCQLGFDARYSLIEDFLQAFYIEALKAFRRENELVASYQPRTKLELAEYITFVEQYAKRRINLPCGNNQQLIILRAQGFARRQPPETVVDIEMAVESAKTVDAESYYRNSALQEIKSKMTAQINFDPSEEWERDRVIAELVKYLESQGQSDCVDYLCLKLQDLSAPEIDKILNISSRQRDYLQQRFKYHVEKFAKNHHWQLVHQWLGVGLDQKFGLTTQQWEIFMGMLSLQQRQILDLKISRQNDQTIAQSVKCTPKQVQRRWSQLLEIAWNIRNDNTGFEFS